MPPLTHPPSADQRPLTCSSKATGDPWLTDGSYLDGSGFARISFEKQFSNTKRFDQELRLVSYNGIIFFLKQEARLMPGATLTHAFSPFCFALLQPFLRPPKLTLLCPVPAEPVLVPGGAGRHPCTLL